MGFEVVAAAQGSQGGDRQLLAVHLMDAALPQVRQSAMKVFLQNKSHHQPAAGMQLRQECARQMAAQGHPEPTGTARLTPAYNLPCRDILHTVGPIISGPLTDADCRALASCYQSCLDLAAENGLDSVVFCCISTGVFGYPPEAAARVAVDVVRRHLACNDFKLKVVFDVFLPSDQAIYAKLLDKD